MTEQRPEPLRLGSTAPNFKAETTQGDIDFHGKPTTPQHTLPQY